MRGEPVLTRVGSECCCGVTCRDADSSLPDLKRKLCISGHFRSFQVISGHFRSFQVISGHFRSFQNMFWPALEAVPFLIFVIFSPVPREWCGEVRMDRIKQSSPGRREEQTWAQLCDEFNIYDKSFQTFTHFKSWLLPNWSAGMLCILLQFSEVFG